MSGLTDMTLKILYTLVDGSSTTTNTSYLARSKKPHRVRVANIPNPNNHNHNHNNDSDEDDIDNNNNNNNNNSINNINNSHHKFNGFNNNDCGITLKVGAISLSTILDEIYINSPEVLENNNIKFDYNVYYRDICEMNEPLVSLGLLSKIQSKLSISEKKLKQKTRIIDGQTPETEYENSDIEEDEDEEDSEDDEDDDMVVTGRVCSNFSALLRRSYSNSHKKNSKKNVSTDTLEIKLKFTRIIQSKKPSQSRPMVPQPSASLMMSKRQNTTIINSYPSSNNNTAQYAIPSLPTKQITKINKPKRQTNPMPAPKAKRTQSLPVWNMDPSNTSINSRKGKNSIAHKIFMADKLNEGSSPSSNSKTQVFTYDINALQKDNTIQKHIVDDSISKRFDFMNNKPLGNSSSPLTGNANSMSTTPVTTATTPAATTASITKTTKAKRTKSIRKPRAKSTMNKPNTTKRRRQSTTTATITTTSVATAATTITPLNDLISQLDSNKENIPPLNDDIAPLAERMDTKPIDPIHTDQLDLNMLDFNDGSMNWFEDMSKLDNNMNNNIKTNNHASPTFLFENGNIKFSDLIMDPQTLKYGNNNNNNNNNKETPKDTIVEDPDKTSPLDTLSMPLMELEEASKDINDRLNKKSNDFRKHVPTCKEQLKRLPILAPSQSNLSQHNSNNNSNNNNNLKKDERMEDIAGSEATVLLNYNTSPTNTLSNQNSSKTDLEKIKNGINNNNNFQGSYEIDDEEKKQNRILPSSPSMIFEYRTNPYHDEDDDDDEKEQVQGTNSPDLFTTFLNQNHDKNNTNSNSQDDKFSSDFNEMRHSNDSNYTPATTVHFTSDEK